MLILQCLDTRVTVTHWQIHDSSVCFTIIICFSHSFYLTITHRTHRHLYKNTNYSHTSRHLSLHASMCMCAWVCVCGCVQLCDRKLSLLVDPSTPLPPLYSLLSCSSINSVLSSSTLTKHWFICLIFCFRDLTVPVLSSGILVQWHNYLATNERGLSSDGEFGDKIIRWSGGRE